VPNLEIETGNIQGAGHAAATGRFDDEQIFYLMSRGVPEVQAKRLVVRGFLADVISRIPDEDIRARMIAGVERRLGNSDPRFDGMFNE
jgi:Fe-S cluster assembly protein SufD